MTSIGVAIPSIPIRATQLSTAIQSVVNQTRCPNQISVAVDHDREGAAPTRNRAAHTLSTEWIAFLDDDDTLEPEHLYELLLTAESTDADLVYPWFHIKGGNDPLAVPDLEGALRSPFGMPFETHMGDYILNVGNFIPVTYIVRSGLFKSVDGFPKPQSEEWNHTECEDWGFLQRVVRSGAKIVHHPNRTWTWNHHGKNTSGRADRW